MSNAVADTRNRTGSKVDVGVNLAFIAPGRVGGSEEYLVRQLMGLNRVASDRFDLTLYVQPGFVEAHGDLMAAPTESRAIQQIVTMPFDRDWRGARIVLEHTWFRRLGRRHDIVHHGGGTAPLNTPRPAVVTIHDSQYLDFPENFSRARLTYLRQMTPRTLARADVVAVPSEFVRATLVGNFDIEPESVVVVPHGVPSVERPSDSEIASALLSIGLPPDSRYVIYPAITHPHKRHRILIEMLGDMTDHRLVLLGGQGASDSDVAALIAATGVEDRVFRPGRVSDATRDALLAGADALVFPSEYEGFGAPLVEAMEMSTPVVCSDHAAIREVVGDAAVIVPGDAVSDWAAGVREAITRHDDLVERGRARRQAFSIDVSGAALANAYQRAADGRAQSGRRT